VQSCQVKASFATSTAETVQSCQVKASFATSTAETVHEREGLDLHSALAATAGTRRNKQIEFGIKSVNNIFIFILSKI
jgi:hypothetical protein